MQQQTKVQLPEWTPLGEKMPKDSDNIWNQERETVQGSIFGLAFMMLVGGAAVLFVAAVMYAASLQGEITLTTILAVFGQ
jgi:hypothetical protein